MASEEAVELKDNPEEKSDSTLEIKEDSSVNTSDSNIENLNSTSTSSVNQPSKEPIMLNEEVNDKIFGNDYSEETPFKLGNTYCFLYYKGQPMIVVGPDCK